MQPRYLLTVSSVLLAFLTVSGSASAQVATESAVLNSLEVQQLITRGQPADHARLEVHFATLAEQYALDARRHAAMARAFVAAPTRRTTANTAADHCKRLEQLNLKSAETLRKLAAHHEALAGGKASARPGDGARFERGEGASVPTTDQIAELAAKAATPADHRALAEYFDTAVKRYTADVDAHRTMANAYRGTRIAQAAAHCDRLVNLSRDAAKEAAAAAAQHRQLAAVPN